MVMPSSAARRGAVVVGVVVVVVVVVDVGGVAVVDGGWTVLDAAGVDASGELQPAMRTMASSARRLHRSIRSTYSHPNE
jgi:hypothetical protein